MAFLFRRNKAEDITPTISGSYQTTTNERVGVAWLLAFVTLAVTVMLAFALFFGGRWAWRTAFNSDSTSETATDQQVDIDLGDTTPVVRDESQPITDNNVVDNSVDNDVENDATTESQELVNTGADSVNALPSELPNTGPDLDL